MENLYEPNCIRTFSGEYFNVFEPDQSKIHVEDIAHALSMQCRFGGHLKKFYSVAEHSVMCSMMASDDHFDALMHDASEAYLMDIPTPIKARMTNYRSIEEKLMTIMAQKFGFQWPLSHEVKVVDRIMLETEWEEVHIGFGSGKLECWAPEIAKEKFLERFHFLRRDKENQI